jgi:hypothetical protein
VRELLLAGRDECGGLVDLAERLLELGGVLRAQPQLHGGPYSLHLDEEHQVVEDGDPVDALLLVLLLGVDDLGAHGGVGQQAQLAPDVLLEQLAQVVGEGLAEAFETGEVQAQGTGLRDDGCG